MKVAFVMLVPTAVMLIVVAVADEWMKKSTQRTFTTPSCDDEMRSCTVPASSFCADTDTPDPSTLTPTPWLAHVWLIILWTYP